MLLPVAFALLTTSAVDDRHAYALTLDDALAAPVFRPKNPVEVAAVHVAREALAAFDEGDVVELIVTLAPELMNVDDPAPIRAALGRRYDELDADALWTDVPSPLSSAFTPAAPLVLVAPPRDLGVDPATAPVVVFLHGYGGNGRIFAWLLSRALPGAWVVAPSHGVSWARPRLPVLDAALAAFDTQTRGHHGALWLVGLSDGGVGAFEVLAARPDRFAGLVNIVGLPRPETIARVPRGVPQLWLNGRDDRFVSAATVKKRYAGMRAHGGDATLAWDDAGHYFLLDDDAAALARLRTFVMGGGR